MFLFEWDIVLAGAFQSGPGSPAKIAPDERLANVWK
jgi:hypothetical protein